MQQQEKNKNNNKGFNLLELLIVISIVGLVSAIAYPNFSEWNRERQVRQAVAKIQSLLKDVLIQTERGTFAYVQVLFNNTGDNLVVTSKGMTMQTLATKINDGTSDWNRNILTRCNTGSDDYWDTDLDSASTEVKNAVYSITLEDVTTNFINEVGAVCFARNGKFYEGSGTLNSGLGVPYEFIFICRRYSDVNTCDISYDQAEADDEGEGPKMVEIGGDEEEALSGDPVPSSEVKYLRRIHWGRFGNILLSKYRNEYTIDAENKEKLWSKETSYWLEKE